jgi:hypothetical protein
MAGQARFHDEISRISTSFQAMRSELDTAEAMLSQGLSDRRVPDVADLEGEAERQARVATLRDALEADLAKAVGAFGDAVKKLRQSFDGYAEPAGIKRVLGWTAKWSAPRPGQGRSGSDPLTDLLEVAQAFHTLLDKERAALITSRHRFEMGLLDMAGHRDELLRGLMNEDLSRPEAVGRTEGLLRLLNGMTDRMNAGVMTLNILRHKLLFDTGDLLAVHRALWQREPPLQGLVPYVVPAAGRFAESALLAGGAGQARRVAQQAFADRFLPKEPDPGFPDDGSEAVAVRPVQTKSDRRWKMPQWPFVGFLRS